MTTNENLLERVQEALSNDSKLKSCIDNIYILVHDGAVIVAGSVTDEYLKARANNIASAVPGVNLLIEDLKVEPVHHHRRGIQIDWNKGHIALV